MPKIGDRYDPRILGNFTALEDWLSRLSHTVMSWNEKALFARLRRFGESSGEIFPSVEKLAKELGMEERSVQRSLASLEEKHFIERERQKNAPSRFFLTRTKEIPGTDQDDLVATDCQTTEMSIDKSVNRQKCHPETTEVSFASLGSEETNLRNNNPSVSPQESSEEQNQDELVDIQDLRRMFVQVGYRNPSASERREAAMIFGDRRIDKGRAEEILQWAKTRERPPGFVALVRLAAKADSEVATVRRKISEVFHNSPVIGSMQRAAGKPPELPKTATRWNVEVPDGPMVEVWTWDLQHLVDAALQDQRFEANYTKLLEKCNAICGREKGNFLTFEWMLKNWAKILNGGCKWVFSEDKGDSAKRPTYQTSEQRKRSAIQTVMEANEKKLKDKYGAEHA